MIGYVALVLDANSGMTHLLHVGDLSVNAAAAAKSVLLEEHEYVVSWGIFAH